MKGTIPLIATLLAFLSVLTGCAAPKNGPTLNDEPNPAESTSSVSTRNQAVHHFVQRARNQFRRSQLNAAEETINRGLNIDSENPVLWHILAKIRFLQKKYPESETFATRSIDYTGRNRQLTNQNWRLIAHARKGSGDRKGAKLALKNVEVEEEEPWWVFW